MLDAAIHVPLVPEAVRQHVVDTFLPPLEMDQWLDALRGCVARTLDPHDAPELAARHGGPGPDSFRDCAQLLQQRLQHHVR